MTDTDALMELLGKATPGPWAYRPDEYDDWGTVRVGLTQDGWRPHVARANGPHQTEEELNEHRRNKTDPAEHDARLIALAPDLAREVIALRAEIARIVEYLKACALTEIVGAAIQLGIEQGRRIAKSDEHKLLDEAYGATFTVTIGHNWTHVHTTSGMVADPTDCLSKAIEALGAEMARVQRCPRQQALCAIAMEARQGGDACGSVHDSAAIAQGGFHDSIK